ncbi:hypothetical protein BV898_19248 [Hypsibius exemplaris]|uniref:Uncharacterized protein n=1 Tax=Hypsibius exemplaris TaxID=2072580 RepID=A0A9X6NIL3_HYPEX|nr:hypothetical protein BV898_19248 [Hypsibius exemplaris]
MLPMVKESARRLAAEKLDAFQTMSASHVAKLEGQVGFHQDYSRVPGSGATSTRSVDESVAAQYRTGEQSSVHTAPAQAVGGPVQAEQQRTSGSQSIQAAVRSSGSRDGSGSPEDQFRQSEDQFKQSEDQFRQ